VLNAIVEAMRTRLETLEGFNVLGPGYVIALSQKIEVARLKISKTQLPAILLNYQKFKIEKRNTGYAYIARGSVIVAVDNRDIEKSVEQLYQYVANDGYVYKELLKRPAPSVEGKNVILDAGEAFMLHFPEDDYFLAMNIPCDIEVWI